jgi:ribosomal protein L11 methyltransferase
VASFPALDVQSDLTDGLLALIDDFEASALEQRAELVRVYFWSANVRTEAQGALRRAGYSVEPVDVDDEDWAGRSQQGLEPVTVGRITVFPGPNANAGPQTAAAHPIVRNPDALKIFIQPSMGFGTGHHATTRLCLRALQELHLKDALALDIGTGSGVLAISAVGLGAARAIGIDHDADAIAAARANLRLNPGSEGVEFRVADLASANLPRADVVFANLTGASLVRMAGVLRRLVRPAGRLVVSGLLDEERDEVILAFADADPDRDGPGPQGNRATAEDVERALRALAWEEHEEGWTALMFVL